MGFQGRLLERESELAVLHQAIKALSQGSSGFLVLQGRAGLGKSRLLAETRRAAEGTGARVLSARGSDLERGFAFGMVRQLFEPVLAHARPEEREALLSGAASPAASLLGQAETGTALVGDLAILHSLFWLTANLAQSGPLALVLDDLQWADEASLRYLAFLLPRMEELGVLAVVALRPDEPGAHEELLDRVTMDPACELLMLSPLSRHASDQLVRTALPGKPDPAFLAACSNAAGGNPLLLWELAGALTVQGVEPTRENAASVTDLGAHAVGRRVGLYLKGLRPDSAALVYAVAVLGGEALLEQAAVMAGLTPSEAKTGVRELVRADLVKESSLGDGQVLLAFVHPLVQAAVYDRLPYAERARRHRRVAELLDASGEEVERVAAHLLRIDPGDDPWVVTALRKAGADALRRGAPEAALRYLQRCLAELPVGSGERLELLIGLGSVAALVDLGAAASYLREALDLTGEPHHRAQITYQLGRVLFYLNQFEEMVQLHKQALSWIPDSDTDLQRRMYSGILQVEWLFVRPEPSQLSALVTQLEELRPDSSVGGKLLDGVLSSYTASVRADRAVAVAEAERAILDDELVKTSNADVGLIHAWITLLQADHEAAMVSLDSAVTRSHRSGSTFELAATLTWRGHAWMLRGELKEAENDCRVAMKAAETSQLEIARVYTGPFLADVLIEQGRLAEAAVALDWVRAPDPLPPLGLWFNFLYSKAKWLRARGRTQEALETALEAGRHLLALDLGNPALVPWRSVAALCLHDLDRDGEARDLAGDALTWARRWGAPRALGDALRVAGLLTPGPEGLELLCEAVTTLEHSSARLEHVRALLALGGRLRRSGKPSQARPCLKKAFELARALNAEPMATEARAESGAAGIRLRSTAITGPLSLTPSERRVVDLAASGHGNRDIAQRLFITIKTVEVHLTSAYRKLGINRREQLTAALNGQAAAISQADG